MIASIRMSTNDLIVFRSTRTHMRRFGPLQKQQNSLYLTSFFQNMSLKSTALKIYLLKIPKRLKNGAATEVVGYRKDAVKRVFACSVKNYKNALGMCRPKGKKKDQKNMIFSEKWIFQKNRSYGKKFSIENFLAYFCPMKSLNTS